MGNCNLLYKQSNFIGSGELLTEKRSPRKRLNHWPSNSTSTQKDDRRTNCNSQCQSLNDKSGREEEIIMHHETEESQATKVSSSNSRSYKPIILIQKNVRRYLKLLKLNPLKTACDGVRRQFDLFFNLGSNVFYRGGWKNRQRDGLGMMRWSDGDEYFGEWRENKMNGIGKYHNNSTGSKFFGYFVDDFISIYGQELWSDGSCFEGEYRNNLKDGFGFLNFDDGSFYTGEFKGNAIHGFGSFYKSDGAVHQGFFVKNKLNGFGVISSPNGNIFHGEFVNDNKNGFGIQQDIKKRRIYIGTWVNSKLEGEVVIVENRQIKKFEFKNSKKVRERRNCSSKFDKMAEEFVNDEEFSKLFLLNN